MIENGKGGGTTTGSGLSNLFLNNQASPQVSMPNIPMPQQSALPAFGSLAPVAPKPAASPAPAAPGSTLTGVQKMVHDYYNPPFQPDPNREGYGWMQTFAGTEHGMPMYDRHYVSAPVTQAMQAVAAPPAKSQAQLLAEAINQRAQQRGR